ncbi:MAG: amidase [Acidobacteria bacterium]|nr:amidase [Acidobacteriota bacterium]
MENNGDFTIQKLAPLIRGKKLSPVELTRFLLERISRFQQEINAYITITADTAMAQAGKAEKEICKGDYRGVLHGIPISLKDLIYTCNVRTTAGAKILRKFVPKENAELVNRLLKTGCVFLGKTNMHEFAFGATNVNPHYGPVHNPWDRRCISGGSSGGSAASVVSAQAMGSFGTDTGGSIRIPAAACGCVGLKPTYGRVPMTGVIPLAVSLDHAGPLSRCVMDAAFLFEATAEPNIWGFNPKRAVAEIGKGIKDFRIGIPRQYFFDRLQPAVRRAVLAAAAVIERAGAKIVEVNLAGMDKTAQLAAEITADEALAYHEKWLEQKFKDYGEDVRSRLELSRKATAIAYIRAQQDRLAYSEEMSKTLEGIHVLLAPTLPVVAPLIDENEVRIGRYCEDVRLALLSLTRPGNLSGLPAISVPCGFSAEGLPIGLQLIGRRSGEASLLRVAYAYEQATPWHLHFPPEIQKERGLAGSGKKRGKGAKG